MRFQHFVVVLMAARLSTLRSKRICEVHWLVASKILKSRPRGRPRIPAAWLHNARCEPILASRLNAHSNILRNLFLAM